MASGAVPALSSRKLIGALVVVTGTPPNASAAVDRLAIGAVAVPVSVMLWVLLFTALLLSVKVNVALRGPRAGFIGTGVNTIVTVQPVLTASALGAIGQPLLWMA